MKECLSVYFARQCQECFVKCLRFIIACWMLGVGTFPLIAYSPKDLDN